MPCTAPARTPDAAGWRSPGVRHECGVLLLARRTSVKPVPEKNSAYAVLGTGLRRLPYSDHNHDRAERLHSRRQDLGKRFG